MSAYDYVTSQRKCSCGMVTLSGCLCHVVTPVDKTPTVTVVASGDKFTYWSWCRICNTTTAHQKDSRKCVKCGVEEK